MGHTPTPQIERETLRVVGHRDGMLCLERVYVRELGSGVEDKSVREWLPLDVVTAAFGRITWGSVNTRDLPADAVEMIEHHADRLTVELGPRGGA